MFRKTADTFCRSRKGSRPCNCSRHSQQKVFVFFFSLLLLIALPAASHSETFKIGAILPLTGEFAMEATEFQRGIDIAVEEINQRDHGRGAKVTVQIEDSQYQARLAVSAAKKMIEIDRVLGVVTATYTEVMATGPMFEQRKIPLIHLWDSSDEIERLGHHIFAIGPWAPSSGEKAAEFAASELKSQRPG